MKKPKDEELFPKPYHTLSVDTANQQTFLRTMRALVQAYQAFAAYSDAHVRQFGLTSAQFDVIVALGQVSLGQGGVDRSPGETHEGFAAGITMAALAAKIRVTKGTLTGIVDRLETKNLVQRQVPDSNRRSFTVRLTAEGKGVFDRVFPAHVVHLRGRFEKLERAELELLKVLLEKLRDSF